MDKKTQKIQLMLTRSRFQGTLWEELSMRNFDTSCMQCAKGQFMSARDKDNRLICVKCLLSKLKRQKPEMICFFSDKKKTDQD